MHHWLANETSHADSVIFEIAENRLSQTAFQKTVQKRKVLVVDDEKTIADTVAEILNQNGFDAEASYSGDSAIASVQTNCPDILVSDVMMPKTNGIQVAMAVRSNCPNTRILLFSGQATTADLLDHARSQGHSFEILAKPLHPRQLLKALQ